MIAVDFSHLDTGRFGRRPWAVHTSSPRSLRDRRSRSPGPYCGTWPRSHTGLDHKRLRATSWRSKGRETPYLHYKKYIQIKLKNWNKSRFLYLKWMKWLWVYHDVREHQYVSIAQLIILIWWPATLLFGLVSLSFSALVSLLAADSCFKQKLLGSDWTFPVQQTAHGLAIQHDGV